MKKNIKIAVCLLLISLMAIPVFAYASHSGNAGSISVSAYLNSSSSSVYAGTETSSVPFSIYTSAYCKDANGNNLDNDSENHANYQNGVKVDNHNYSVAEVYLNSSSSTISTASSAHIAYEVVYNSSTGKYQKGEGYSKTLAD